MDNLYITKDGNFGYPLSEKMPFDANYQLVLDWVKEYNLDAADTKCFSAVLEDNRRYRVCLFNSDLGWNAALRLLPDESSSFADLNIEEKDVISCVESTGLALFCGPTGAGKSTTMSTVVKSLLESNKLGVTVSIEDPIEFRHNHKSIFQREVGVHTESFELGLRAALRANPQTIIIGEIRDAQTALEAVRAGLNGHRVLATLHASSVSEAIARLWAFLDDQGDEMLIQALQGVVAQHLIRLPSDKNYCLYETIQIDEKAKTLLGQIISGNAKGGLNMLNNVMFEQSRVSLKEKATGLVQSGKMPRNLLTNFL